MRMDAERQAQFANTVSRVVDNLAVARNARDAELHAKVTEVQEQLEEFGTDYGGGGGEFARM